MRMLGTCINAKVGHNAAAQLVARQHPLDGLHDNTLRMRAFENLTGRAGLDAARVTSVPIVRLVALLARQLNFVGVNHDHVVAHVHVRSECGLVLAAQAHCDDRSKTTQNNAFCVDQDPAFFDLRGCCGIGAHCVYPSGVELMSGF